MEEGRWRTGLLQHRYLVVDGESGTAGAMTKRRTIIFVFVTIRTFRQFIFGFSFLHHNNIHITAGQTAQRQYEYGH
jgi:hypothetical protein